MKTNAEKTCDCGRLEPSKRGSAYEWTSEQMASVEWKPAKVVEA